MEPPQSLTLIRVVTLIHISDRRILLIRSRAEFFDDCRAQACGRPAGTFVTMKACRGSLTGTPRPCTEVSEIRFFSLSQYQDMADRAPAAELVLADLSRRELID